MPVSMMLAPKVTRSTIAADSRGSVKLLVQPQLTRTGTLRGAGTAEVGAARTVLRCPPRDAYLGGSPRTAPRATTAPGPEENDSDLTQLDG